MKYIVTTRKEVLENLKEEGYYIIGIDGTVPEASNLYDELYDHHKKGGSEIQLHELPKKIEVANKKIAIVTTMVDADAIVSAFYLDKLFVIRDYSNDKEYSKKVEKSLKDNYSLLEAISYDCDHLLVPERLEQFEELACSINIGLRIANNELVKELKLPEDRKLWSIEEKEKYASEAFLNGVVLLEEILESNESYWYLRPEVKKEVEKINNDSFSLIERVSYINNVAICNGENLEGYISPKSWYKAITFSGIPFCNLALFKRDINIKGEYKGVSYSLGAVPLHPFNKNLDLAPVWEALNKIESGWGGRATVGGSPWNNPSKLSPEEIVNIISLTLN